MNTLNLTTKDIERFWSKVSRTDDLDSCWEWKAKTVGNGYGQISIGGRPENGGRFIMAHRIAYELELGEIPEGLRVLHTCDNPSCCNPRHLFVGTDKDNAIDKMKKGRWRGGCPPGENSSRAKLTWDQVYEIREKYRTGGFTMQMLASEYGIWKGTIAKIINNQTWKEIE